MTNKEAIEMLDILRFRYRDADGTEFRMALDLAIKALEEKENMESAIDWWRKKTEADPIKEKRARMTKKEAIKYFQNHQEVGNKEQNEAVDLAVKALMAYRDCKHCVHNIKIGNMRGCELWDCDFEEQKGGVENE